MKKLLFLTLSFCLAFTAFAGDRTEQEMQQIALSQLMGSQTKGLFPTTFHVDRLATYDEFNVYGNSDGYVFVSRNDRVRPVLGIAEVPFDFDNMPEGLKWWIETRNASLARLRQQGYDMEASQARHALLMASYSPVSNFVQTRWDQYDPYNALCPKVDGNLPPTGCVATAMAQIMKYFAYPAKGKGEGAYTTVNSKNVSSNEIRSDINGTYNWAAMKNIYAIVKDEDRKVVGTLMRDCGYGAHMTYEAGGSGAHTHVAARSFCYNFSYDSLAVRYYSRDLFSEDDWMKLVYDELTARRPILYGGVDAAKKAGHAFVFSGFDSEGRVYVNWGWSGGGNGFYDITDLSPIMSETTPPADHFNSQQDMIIGLKAHETPDPEDFYESMFETDNEGWSLSMTSAALRLKTDTFYNLHFLDFYGSVGIYFEDVNATPGNDNSAFIPISYASGIMLTPFRGLGGTTASFSMSTQLNSLPNGTYRVSMASKHLKESKPSIVRQIGKGAIYYEVTKSGTTAYTISDPMAKELEEKPQLIYMVDGEVYKTYKRKAGEPITPEPDPVKPGYTFSGWTGLPSVMPNHDVTVTGTFTENPRHTLTYKVGDAVYKTVSLPEGIEITPEPSPEKEGYIFSGWTDLPATMPDHDITVTGTFLLYFEVTLSSTGYATFFDSKTSFTLPEGVTAQVVESVSGGKLVFKTVAGTPESPAVPKNVAVLLQGPKDATVTLTESPASATYTGSNLLHGSDAATTTTASGSNLFYKLAFGASGTYQSDVFGWYWGAADGAAFKIEGHKAWLAVPVAAVKARAAFFQMDGTAGINELPSADVPAGDVYDLQGRRYDKPVSRGIYVVGGRKVFVK